MTTLLSNVLLSLVKKISAEEIAQAVEDMGFTASLVGQKKGEAAAVQNLEHVTLTVHGLVCRERWHYDSFALQPLCSSVLVPRMTCSSCVASIEGSISAVAGVESVRNMAQITYAPFSFFNLSSVLSLTDLRQPLGEQCSHYV